MNEVTVHGHVGKAPTISHSNTGVPVVRFSLAVNSGYYDRSRRWISKPTVWHEVVVFNELANNVYDTLSAADKGGKGVLLTVTGVFADNSWTKSFDYADVEDIRINRIELHARDIAVSLARATAVVTRKSRDTEQTATATEETAAPAAEQVAAVA